MALKLRANFLRHLRKSDEDLAWRDGVLDSKVKQIQPLAEEKTAAHTLTYSEYKRLLIFQDQGEMAGPAHSRLIFMQPLQ
mgnify:CR=1 FL=1